MRASAYQPILSHLIRELGWICRSCTARSTRSGADLGSLAVYASGEAAKIESAVEHLRAAVWWCRCPWRRR
jgi:D-methionine transport system ATP-binding protein